MLQLIKHRLLDDWYPVSHSIGIDHTCNLGCVFCPSSWQENPSSKTEQFSFEEKEWGVSKQFIGIGGGLYEAGGVERPMKNWLGRCLNYLLKNNNKVLIQTRSTSIIETLEKIDEELRNNIIVIMGFFSIENQIATHFEPNIASPTERLRVLKKLKAMGYAVGANLMPIVPQLNGEIAVIKMAFNLFKEHGASFALYQKADKETMEQIQLKTKIPLLRGQVDEENFFKQIRECYHDTMLLPRLPWVYFCDWLREKEKIAVALRYLYYYHLFMGKSRDAYKVSAHHIARLEESEWSALKDEGKLLKVPGVGVQVEKVIKNFLTENWDFLDNLEAKMRDGR